MGVFARFTAHDIGDILHCGRAFELCKWRKHTRVKAVPQRVAYPSAATVVGHTPSLRSSATIASLGRGIEHATLTRP